MVLREFWGDLKKSVGAWRVAPLLPILTLALSLPGYLVEVERLFDLISFFTAIFYVGYVGTERLWYLAVWTGRPFGAKDIWTNSWRYFRRYLGLGIVMVLAFLLLLVPGAIISGIFDLGWSASGGAMLIVPTILVDVWFTFMTPALAYSTESVGEGLSIGWRMLKQHWRHCFPYALAPPLAGVILLQRASPEFLETPVRLGLAVVGVLSYLALKGATAAYYVRHYPVSVEELVAAGSERPRGVTAR